MATLSFDGETHDEILHKVKRWLASLEDEASIGVSDVVERAAELTKDALGVIAAAAPKPVAQSEVMKALTRSGYETTDTTSRAVVEGLSALSEVTGGGLVKRVEGVRKGLVYEMNAAVARQLLKALRGN